ncbi:hypothetical protein UlMin_014952 [Ulmus minor]
MDCKKEVLPFAAMAAVECITVALNTIFKAAAFKGLSYWVFVAYIHVIGTLVLLPLPFIFPRRGLPSFNLSTFFKIVLLSLIGFSANICAYKGIEYSSPALASAIGTLTPAFTFILAVIFRMEIVDLGSSRTRAKIVGTITSISGAFIVIFYKGPKILSPPSQPQSISLVTLETSQANWVVGGLLLVGLCLFTSIWYILQTHIIKIYPSELTVVVQYAFWTAVVAATVGSIAESNLGAWRLRPDITLISVLLSGGFGPVFSSVVHTWGVRLKGPVYVAIFRPFSIAIAAVAGVIFLGDDLYVGSVIGATILLLGFYAVIWGKAKEFESDHTLEANLEGSLDESKKLLPRNQQS